MDYRKIRKNEKKNGTASISTNVVLAVMAVISVIAALVIVTVTISRHHSARSAQNEIAAAVTQAAQTANPDAPVTSEPAVPAVGTAATEQATIQPAQTEAPTTIGRRGSAQAIPDEIRLQMDGVSMHDNDDISYDDLSYLTIPHYDFNYNVTEGHMVVNAALAEEVLDIFAELYDIKYPIERMELVDKYNGSDYDSIDNNNTSSFNYRESTSGSGNLSRHALGRAIDINPQINPYVDGSGSGSHQNAAEYWSRDYTAWSSEVARAAYIGHDSKIYDIFVNEHGWTWGGDWSSYRDYQHFEKSE